MSFTKKKIATCLGLAAALAMTAMTTGGHIQLSDAKALSVQQQAQTTGGQYGSGAYYYNPTYYKCPNASNSQCPVCTPGRCSYWEIPISVVGTGDFKPFGVGGGIEVGTEIVIARWCTRRGGTRSGCAAATARKRCVTSSSGTCSNSGRKLCDHVYWGCTVAANGTECEVLGCDRTSYYDCKGC